LVISVAGAFHGGVPPTDSELEGKLDVLLGSENAKLSIATVANTLFPTSLWNANQPRKALFDRFHRGAVIDERGVGPAPWHH
jgi:hypothetical protein